MRRMMSGGYFREDLYNLMLMSPEPLGEALFKGLLHPRMPATLDCLWNRQPSPASGALLWPGPKLLLHQQGEHHSLAQALRALVVLQSLALELIVPNHMLQILDLKIPRTVMYSKCLKVLQQT